MNKTDIEQKIIKELGPEYDHSAKPHVYFFDYAVQVEGGERPKYKNAVYISKRSKTAHETQDFRRKMTEDDKAEFPREWEHYLKVKENLAKPKVDLLPGIDQATLMEMKAVGIYNLEQLAEQDDFTNWASMARRILNAIETGSEGRDRVRGHAQVEPVGVLAGNRASSRGETEESRQKESWQEKNYAQKNGNQEVSFTFEVIQ